MECPIVPLDEWMSRFGSEIYHATKRLHFSVHRKEET